MYAPSFTSPGGRLTRAPDLTTISSSVPWLARRVFSRSAEHSSWVSHISWTRPDATPPFDVIAGFPDITPADLSWSIARRSLENAPCSGRPSALTKTRYSPTDSAMTRLTASALPLLTFSSMSTTRGSALFLCRRYATVEWAQALATTTILLSVKPSGNPSLSMMSMSLEIPAETPVAHIPIVNSVGVLSVWFSPDLSLCLGSTRPKTLTRLYITYVV